MSTTTDKITRANVDHLLDHGMLQIRMKNKVYQPPDTQRWWTIRRNGKTKLWKRDKARIEIPIKGGLNVFGKIETSDFLLDGTLNPAYYRIKPNGV